MHLQTAAEQQSKLMKSGSKWELDHELLVRKNFLLFLVLVLVELS